jgi:hypothetical protein
MPSDRCALCLKPLVVLEHGGSVQCCPGKAYPGAGYISHAAPLPRDAWASAWRTPRNGWYWYPGLRLV